MTILRKFIYLYLIWSSMILVLLLSKQLTSFILPFICSLTTIFLLLLPLMKKNNYFLYSVLILCSIFLGVDIAALYHTDHLLSSIILTNITEISSVDNSIVYSTIAIILIFLIPIFCINKNKNLYISKLIYLLIIPIGVYYYISPIKPITAFCKTLNYYMQQKLFDSDYNIIQMQRKIYGKSMVYETTYNQSVPDLTNKNIITIFTEGFSAEIIDKFNQYQSLTPYVSELLTKGLYFKNYFNHTAATYRGLRGQLSSSYQYTNGENALFIAKEDKNELNKPFKDGIITLPEILQKHGYHTYFLSAHEKSERLNTYLLTLGFERVFTASDFQSDKDLTDRELFENLNNLIKSKELKEPYFIGVYNIGTHFGTISPDLVYEYNNTNNEILNIFHNFDYQFGQFFKNLQKDVLLRKKTALILTADHAAFFDKNYVETFNDNRNIFMGKIPFILYYDGIEPRIIDVNGRNSLDFTPTLLHMLRIQKAYNYFLGCSIFDSNCTSQFQYIFNHDDIYYHTNYGKLNSQSPIVKLIENYYHLSENLNK